MKIKKYAAGLSSLLLVASLAACSGSNTASTTKSDSAKSKTASKNESVTLRIAWWGNQPRTDYTLKIIDLYEKQHPNVKIESEYASWDDYWKKLAPEAAANNLPDIIQMDTSYVTQYANNNQLADLEPFYGKEINTKELSNDYIDAGKLNKHYYGLPTGSNAIGLQYDPALLKKAGIDSIPQNWTWTDYQNLAKKAVAAGL